VVLGLIVLSSITKKLLAFLAEKAPSYWNDVITLLENILARDKTRPPFVVLRASLSAICGNVFLGNAIDDCSDSGPNAGAGAHRTRLVCGVKDEVGQVTAITAGYILESFQFDMFDAGS